MNALKPITANFRFYVVTMQIFIQSRLASSGDFLYKVNSLKPAEASTKGTLVIFEACRLLGLIKQIKLSSKTVDYVI